VEKNVGQGSHRNAEKGVGKMKLLVLGMDGMDSLFVKRHIEQLPTLKRFMVDGSLRYARSVNPPITGPAWFTIYTGLQPGKHGVRKWTWDKPHSDVAFTLADVKYPTIWELMGDAGLKVGVVHMPMTFPARELNGFIVSGFPSPAIMRNKKRVDPDMPTAYPPELEERVAGVPTDLMDVRKGNKHEDNFPLIENVIASRMELTDELVTEYSPDVLAIGFTMIDRCYHGIMLSQQVPEKEYNTKILEWYKKADQMIADLMTKYEPEDTVIVSDHGGGWKASAPGAPGHNFNATFAGLGQSFKGGWFREGRMITCVAPTLMYILGIPREKWKHMQGKVAREMLRENAEVMDRLRALGYI